MLEALNDELLPGHTGKEILLFKVLFFLNFEPGYMHLGMGDRQRPEEASVSSVVKVPESCKTHDPWVQNSGTLEDQYMRQLDSQPQQYYFEAC